MFGEGFDSHLEERWRWRQGDSAVETGRYAINGQDYIGGEGELVFEHGEVTKMLEIPINDDQVG